MKRYLSLIITLSIITSGILMTGCSSQSTQNVTSQAVASDTKQSKEQNLIDCLNATKKVDSVQCNVNLNSKSGDQSIALKIDMQVENIQKNMKSKLVMETSGNKEEMYLSVTDGKVSRYLKDSSGKFTVNTDDISSSIIDFTKSFDAYTKIVNTETDIVSKIDENTYELNIPKEKTDEIYSEIAGKDLNQSIDKLIIKFVIGNDGYLNNVDVKATVGTETSEISTDYSNYNKKFNIVLPEVSK